MKNFQMKAFNVSKFLALSCLSPQTAMYWQFLCALLGLMNAWQVCGRGKLKLIYLYILSDKNTWKPGNKWKTHRWLRLCPYVLGGPGHSSPGYSCLPGHSSPGYPGSLYLITGLPRFVRNVTMLTPLWKEPGSQFIHFEIIGQHYATNLNIMSLQRLTLNVPWFSAL